MMLSLNSTIVLFCATLLALLIPFAGLHKCRACGQLALRTQHPRHNCPSRYHTKLAQRWIGFVLLWMGAAVASQVLFN